MTPAAVLPAPKAEAGLELSVGSVAAGSMGTRFGIGFLIGAAAGAGLGLLIASGQDVGERGPAEILGLALVGAIVGGFVGLATGSGG